MIVKVVIWEMDNSCESKMRFLQKMKNGIFKNHHENLQKNARVYNTKLIKVKIKF